MDNADAWSSAQDAIEAVRHGRPTVLVIEGEAGLGKSRLLKRLFPRLDGFEVHRAYGEPDAADVAFSTLRELTAATGIAEPVNAFQSVSELLTLVDARQRESPLAFLIDDLQWADAESVRALAGLLRRVEGDRLLVAVATRPLGRTHPEWQRTLRDATTVTIQLGGLSLSEVTDLAREFDPAASADLAAALHAHTAGNPLHIISLLNEHPVASLSDMAAGDELPAPLQLAEHVEARVRELSPDAGELLSALAVLGDGWVTLETAAMVGEVADARAAARVLTQERLVRTRRATLTDIRIFHSVIRAAVYEVIPDARRRRLHEAAAERVHDPSDRLRHRVASGGGSSDPELSAQLVAHAQTRHLDGQFREAARLLRMAASVTADRATHDALLLDAQFEGVLGADPEASRERLGSGDARDRLVVAMSLTGQAEWQRAWAVLAVIDDEDLDTLPELVAHRVRVLRLFNALGAGRPGEEILAEIDAAERLRADPALHRYLLFTKLQVSAWTFADEDEFWEMSGLGTDRAVLASTREGTTLLAWRGINYALDGNPEDAIADLGTATALIGVGGLDFTEGTYHAMLGLAYFLVGDVGRAGASIEVSLSTGLTHTHPVSLAISGLRQLLGGDATASRAIMADVRAGLLRNRYRGALLTADTVDLLVLLTVGTDAERREWVRRRRQELGDPLAEDLNNLAPSLWLGLHGLAATWVGDASAAREWADQLAAVAYSTPWRDAMVSWIRVRIDELDGHDSTEALRALAVGFDTIPALRSVIEREAAASARRHARAGLGDPAPLAEAGVREEGRSSELPRATATEQELGVLASLSDRERAVVALVAGGMSYAQIAKELYITRSTVGFHLSKCYAKTDTRSRHELAELARAAGMSTQRAS